jgi:integrase/recombinase XerD
MTGPAPTSPSLAQAIEEYLDWQALDRGRSPNTVPAYGADLAGFRAFAADAAADQLADVDRDLLRAFQSALARGRRGAKPLAPQTRHRRLVALRSFLRFCAREEWTPGDLGVAIDLPKLPKRLPKPLQAAELERVAAPSAAHLDEPQLRDRALVAFLLSTGCRISEALQLNRADWQRERVIVRPRGTGAALVGPTSSRHARRGPDLSKSALYGPGSRRTMLPCRRAA